MQRYSLKDGIPSFLANIAGKILTTGKYLNVMRECGHSAQVFFFFTHYSMYCVVFTKDSFWSPFVLVIALVLAVDGIITDRSLLQRIQNYRVLAQTIIISSV